MTSKNKAMPFMAVWLCFSRRSFPVMALKNKGVLLYGLLCFMLFNLSTAWAQSAESRTAEGQSEIKPLQIGDTIPEELWNLPLQVVNHPDGKDTITLNDYRNKKLIILDFWNTGCGSCIASFDKVGDLNAEFKEDVAILLCNSYYRDSREKVNAVLNKSVLNFRVPSSLNSLELNAYFPHRFVPHIVWIGNDGKVLSTSSSSEMDSIQIANYLNGELLDLVTKEDDVDFEPNMPLLVNGNGASEGSFRYRSIFIDEIKGIGRTVGWKKYNGGTRFYALNQSVLNLLKIAWPALAGTPDNRVDINSIVLDLNDGDTQLRFCYELIVPQKQNEAVHKLIRDDIERYTQLTVIETMERRPYWVITTRDDLTKREIRSDGQKDKRNARRDMKLSEAVMRLNYIADIPLVLEQRAKGDDPPISIELPENQLDMQTLKRILEEAGLLVEERVGDIEVFKVADIKG
ncbi:TlpA family protein disulfide reductase [Sphingobacterium arenae]|uniref:Redoxin domain-containing protein n=1 Tax=Sphingobacterium arenae TaxID=1280598 RepID=A0ABR7Y439_9SPHI|nr:redoxin family protein [Sphingobacterium arenae]MBD1426075.1 redoxin domain-containing protein [Sphingobacterium arenae]